MDEDDKYWIIKYRGYKKIDDIKLEMNLLHKEYSRFLLYDILDKIDNLIKFSNNQALEIDSDINLHIHECLDEILPPLIKIIKKNIS